MHITPIGLILIFSLCTNSNLIFALRTRHVVTYCLSTVCYLQLLEKCKTNPISFAHCLNHLVTLFTPHSQSHSATNYLHSYPPPQNFIIGSSILSYLIVFPAMFVTLRLLAQHLPNILLGCAEINVGFGIKFWKETTRIDTVVNMFHHRCFQVISTLLLPCTNIIYTCTLEIITKITKKLYKRQSESFTS